MSTHNKITGSEHKFTALAMISIFVGSVGGVIGMNLNDQGISIGIPLVILSFLTVTIAVLMIGFEKQIRSKK